MGFSINCDNKGCGKLTEPVIDVGTNQVICVDCGKEIKNVTSFAKTQMKSLGQTRKAVKKQQSWAIKCESCKLDGQPVLKDDKFYCSGCKSEIKTISGPFKQILKQQLKPKTTNKK